MPRRRRDRAGAQVRDTPTQHSPQATAQPPAIGARGRGIAWPNLVLATLVFVMGAGGAARVVRNERRLRDAKRGGPS